MQVYRQTDNKQTGTLITILDTPPRGEVINQL